MAKGKKLDFKKIAMNTLIVGGTGALSKVIAVMLEGEDNAKGKDGAAMDWKENADIADYAMIAAGIILPEVMKSDSVELAANALLAIGAYRMSERLDIPGKVGVNGMGSIPGSYNIGKTWNPIIRTEKKQSTKTASNLM